METKRIDEHKNYILPKKLLLKQLNYIHNEIEKILPLKSKENAEQVNFAFDVIGNLIDIIHITGDEKINVHVVTSSLRAASKDYENEAKLMNEILNTVFTKMTNNVDDKTLSKLVKDSTDLVLAPYKPKTIFYWILIAIVVIVGILFILGLILGFIYAIRAEQLNTKWSTKRVIGRTFLGFAFVAMYWSKYGIW